MRPVRLLAPAIVLAATVAAATPDIAAELAKLRATDLRLAAIGHRLTTANAALCRDLAPAPGLTIHALQQYAPALRRVARRSFGFETPVAIEGVVAGGPADRAGVRADDSLVAVAGVPIVTTDPGEAPASSAVRDAASALIAAQPVDAPLTLTLMRGGRRRDVSVPASRGCAVTFEVVIRNDLFAQADGRTVQLGVRYLERYADGDVAVIAAHELAHAILRHRARLEAAGVARGMRAEFGRDRRLTRLVEDEADRLSVHLLRNAGYDPAAAPRHWRTRGSSPLGGRTHARPKDRAVAMEAEISHIPADARLPYLPPLLDERDSPLTEASTRRRRAADLT